MKRVLLLAAVVLVCSPPHQRWRRLPQGRPVARRPAASSFGNGGYDIQRYDLDLRYATSAPTQSIDGTVTILAKGHAGPEPLRPRLGRAEHRRRVTSTACPPVRPGRPGHRHHAEVAAAQRLRVPGDHVQHFVAGADAGRTPTTFSTTAFFFHSAGLRDRAPAQLGAPVPARPTTTRATRRAGTSASTCPPARPRCPTASSSCSGRDRGRTHVCLRPAPADGDRAPAARGRAVRRHERRLPLRRLPARRDLEEHHERGSSRCSAVTPSQIDYMQAAGQASIRSTLYGSLVVEADLGFALETQTLELMDTSWFQRLHAGHVGPDAAARDGRTCCSATASPYSWSDLWLNEGHASWYEFLYAEEQGLPRRRHRVLSRPDRLRRLRRPDEGRLRPW